MKDLFKCVLSIDATDAATEFVSGFIGVKMALERNPTFPDLFELSVNGTNRGQQCKHCKYTFWNTLSPCLEHVQSTGKKKCTRIYTDEEISAVETFVSEHSRKSGKVAQEKNAQATKRLTECSSTTEGPPSKKPQTQQSWMQAQQSWSSPEADLAVAMHFCADGIPFVVARSPWFKNMVRAIKAAGEHYQPPSSEKLRTSLLDKVSNLLCMNAFVKFAYNLQVQST